MIIEKLHIIITIISAIAATVACILMEYPLLRSAVTICITIVVFYIIGSIVKAYTDNAIFNKKQQADELVNAQNSTNTDNTSKNNDFGNFDDYDENENN